MEAVRDHLHKLPESNFNSAKALFNFLHKVQENHEKNLMTSKNLSVILSPTMKTSFATLIFLINNSGYLFNTEN